MNRDARQPIQSAEDFVRKTLYTLNIGNYSPEICQITYPLLRDFAKKCGAEFYIITERRFPHMPLTYEKFQVWRLAQERGDEWSYCFDGDALVYPDAFDPTEHISKDTVMHNGRDWSTDRFKPDNYFRRDGRYIGSGTWFCLCSDWTLDLWRPPDDITLQECLANIQPTCNERAGGVTAEHLIDDYLVSRNIAKYGLKFETYLNLQARCFPSTCFTSAIPRPLQRLFGHMYARPEEQKVKEMKAVLSAWRYPRSDFSGPASPSMEKPRHDIA
jgi:hypothetical protein